MASAGSSPNPTPAISDFERNLLFGEWWSAEARSRYFAFLAGRFSRNNQVVTFLSLLLSSGAVGAILADPHIVRGFIWVKLGLPAGSAAISALSLVRQYSKRTLDCSQLYGEWASIAGECRELWGEMYESSAPERLKALLKRGPEISKRVAGSIGNYRGLMKRCEDEAENEIRRYTGA